MNNDPLLHRRLGDRVWTDLVDRAPVLLVPLGSCEQHGPHLPLRTDTIIASALADRASAALTEHGVDTLVTPPIEITASGEHQGFAGTLSIGTDALTTLLVELIRSADWSDGLVLVNGHGGNHEAVSSAVAVATAESRRVLDWWPPPPPPQPGTAAPGDLHAGHVETSVLLALDPGLVHADPAEVAGVALDRADLARMRAQGVVAVSPSGVLGDPRTASAIAGTEILDNWVDDLVGSVRGWLTRR